MKTTIIIVLFLILGLSHQGAKCQFKDGSGIDCATFTILLTNMTEYGTGIQTVHYTWSVNNEITKSMTLNLAGFNLTNSTGYSITLSDGKYFALKNSTGSGVYSGKLSFGSSESVLEGLNSLNRLKIKTN